MASKPFGNSEENPWFWIIAGPNGAGKSTWAASKQCIDILGNLPILNPDHFTEPYTSKPLSYVSAGKRIFQKISQLTKAQTSFAVETTLSGNQYFRLATQLKKNKWYIGTVYIGVEAADVCVTRVEERRLKGGHDVPLEDIVRRYERSLHHISRLLQLVNYLIILDNSTNYKLILEFTEGEISLDKELPSWLKGVIEC